MGDRVPNEINDGVWKGSFVKKVTHPCNSISEHGLPTTGGSMEKNTTRGLNTGVQIDLRVAQRHRNKFQDLLDARIYPTQVRQSGRRRGVVLGGRKFRPFGWPILAGRFWFPFGGYWSLLSRIFRGHSKEDLGRFSGD